MENAKVITVIAILIFELSYQATSNNIPTFITEPADSNVVITQNVEMNCMATGVPVPTVVSWMQNGDHVYFGGRKSILSSGSLRITNALKSDDGYYQCVAKNAVGSVISKRAKLTVAYFDMFYASKEYKTQNAGSSLILIAPTISCSPKAKYTWMKNGIKLTEDNRISISNDNTLYIADLTGTDQGTYTCQAENLVMSQAGKPNAQQIIKDVQLSIGAALPRYQGPSLIRSPKDTTARQGKDVIISLECFPNRSDTTIIWKKNGATIYANQKYRLDATRKRLTINGPIKNDEGQYSCEASYLSKTATGSGNLRVIVPPTYINQKTLVSAKSDNNTILWCNATAYPTFSSTWYHNSQRVFSTGTKFQIKQDRSLHINGLAWNDAGVYQCISQNVAGQLIGTTRLNVINETSVIIQGPKTQYFHVGTTVAVPCIATGAPKPRIVWLKNNQAITLSMTRVSVTTKDVLQITNAQKSDSATYTCVASNGAGEHRMSGYIGIVDPTRITKGPNQTTTAARAVTVHLPCEVSHDPTVAITRDWRRNTVKIFDSRYSVLADGSLQILSTQEKDAATFSCNVYSNGGNASVSTVLRIVSLPYSPSTPVPSEIGTYSLRLTWYAPEYDGGTPLTNYELQIKNQTMTSFKFLMFTSLTSVVVTGLQAGKKYTFRVAARNTLGRGRWSGNAGPIPMKILAPSQAPTNLRLISSEQTKLTLRWAPPPIASHNGDLRGYYVYYRIRGYVNSAFSKKTAPAGLLTATSVTYVLDNLLYFTQYEIKVAAFNDAGTGSESNKIDAETKPGVPSKGPTNVGISVVNSTAVLITYKSPAQIYWNGELIASRGYAYDPGKPLDATAYDAPYNTATRYNQTFLLIGLQPNRYYALRVAVVTASGPSPKSDPVYFRMQEGSPSSPRNFMVTGTYANAITLRWDRPLETNGKLLGYKVGHRVYGAINWIERPEREPEHSNGAIYKGLQLNARYEFYALAFTGAGDGPKVYVDAQTSKTAPTLPGKPSKPMLVVNNGTSITLNWLMSNTGGTLITYYLIESNNQTNYHQLTTEFHEWTLVVNLTRIQDIPARIHNLTTNTVYRFRVTPFNSVGRGPTSNVSEDITTAESVPQAAPTQLRASAPARQELLIEWVPPPKYTWGSAAISYRISLISIGRKKEDRLVWNHPDSQLKSFRARGLAKWTIYNISVSVYNNVGNGPPGGSVLARTAEDVPDNGPAIITPVAISSSVVNVTWTSVPLNLRNGLILGYKIFYNIKLMPTVVFTKHISNEKTRFSLLTGLAGYETYEIRMLAFTKTGDGKKTDPVEVTTPEGIAGKPYKVRFPVVRVDSVKITWQPPLHPNAAIQRYEVAYKLKGTTDNWVDVRQPRYGPNILTADVNGLAGERYYLFRIYARSSLGRGIPAEETVITTANRQVPERPVVLTISLSDVQTTTVLVRWVAPYDGRSPIRSYSLQYNHQPSGWQDYRSNTTGRVDIDASSNQILVAKLLPASSYSFRIKATNDIGDSAWSAASNTIMTHPSAPKGAVTNIKIKPVSATSLQIEWQAPSFEDVSFYLKYRKRGDSNWIKEFTLPKTPLYKKIDNLEIYTVYEIAMAAQNPQGLGPWVIRTGVTGEATPVAAPTKVRANPQDSTTIKVRWAKPAANTIRGNLLGYKIDYQRIGTGKRRKRRSVASVCPAVNNSPQRMIVGPYTAEATIRNVEKFSRYRISILAYNGAGDSPKSYAVIVSTPEGTPSAPFIIWSKAYSDAIDVQWSVPCFSNGYLTRYELQYSQSGSIQVSSRIYGSNVFVARIHNLLSLKNYKVQVRAGTRNGFGEFTTLYITTKDSVTSLPGKPEKLNIMKIESKAMLLEWEEGPDGNTPIKNYKIQYKISDKGEWNVGWEASFNRWIRNGTRIQYRVTNLKPKTRYSFRVIAVNSRGESQPSEATTSLLTGELEGGKPFHAELWFIILLIVVAVLIVALLILFICVKKRSKKSKEYNSALPTKEQQLQQQSRDLQYYLSHDVKDKVIHAYGDEEDNEKERTESKRRSNTETRREPKHKLEKLDLQPLEFSVPKVSLDTLPNTRRKAPEGEENYQNSSVNLRKRTPRNSPEKETRFAYREKKETSIHRQSSSSNESLNEKCSDLDSHDNSPCVQKPSYGNRQSIESKHRASSRSKEHLNMTELNEVNYREPKRSSQSFEILPTDRPKGQNDYGKELEEMISRRASRYKYDEEDDDDVFIDDSRNVRNSKISVNSGNNKAWELSFDDDNDDGYEHDDQREHARKSRRSREHSKHRGYKTDQEYDRDMDNDIDLQYDRHRNADRSRSHERHQSYSGDRSYQRDPDHDRHRSNDRGRSRERGQRYDRDIDYDRHRSTDRGRSHERDRSYQIDPDNDRHRSNDRGRSRERGQNYDRDMDYDRHRSNDRGRSRERDRSYQRDPDHDRHRSNDRGRSRERGQRYDRDMDYDRHRSIDRGRSHERDRSYQRDPDHDRHQSNDRGRSRERGQRYDRDIDYDRHRSTDRGRSHERDRSYQIDPDNDRHRSNDRGRSRERGQNYDRDMDYDRHRSNDRGRSREGSQRYDRDMDYDGHRSNDRGRSRERSQRYDRDMDYDRHRSNDRGRSRERGQRYDGDMDYDRHRSKDRGRSRERDREYDKHEDYDRNMECDRDDNDKDHDYDYLIHDLTRGRARHMHHTENERRSPNNAVKTSENKPGMSSFEMAMVRNRGGSAQRLINSDSEADARSNRSAASKKSRASQDRRAGKEVAIDEKSESTVSKHSDASDNDADKSGNETEEDGKFIRGKAAEASIASHYANDPFYKNWRNSLDKKTRKAILAEYHDRNKKKPVHESCDSIGGSRPYRSASEEGLDRIGRQRGVRPGRSDLSEKKKLTQSDPYLNQEPEQSVSSFSPSVQGDQPRSRRPGKKAIDRAAARSEPSLNVHDSESDSDNRFPPPYEGDGVRVRRKNSFLRARDGEDKDDRRSSREELDNTPVKNKKKMAAELDKALGYYTRAPPPYEDNLDYDSEAKSPPAYTPVQDSSDDSRTYVGYNRGPRNWRPQRQQERRDVSSPQNMEQRNVPNRRSDEFDGPSRTSMTLV